MTDNAAHNITLESLKQLLQDAFADNLVSMVRYGEPSEKIRVLIVVKTLEAADWTLMSSAFDRLRGRASVEPMLLTEQSLKSSTDIFPILIHEMKKGYQVVQGDDIVADLEVQRSHLRLRCEQELRSLQLRMQGICLMHFASPHRLRTALTRDYESFSGLLKIAFELGNVSYESDDGLLRTFASKFDLEIEPLLSAKEFAEGDGTFDEETFGGVYVALMTAVRKAANFADQMPEA